MRKKILIAIGLMATALACWGLSGPIEPAVRPDPLRLKQLSRASPASVARVSFEGRFEGEEIVLEPDEPACVLFVRSDGVASRRLMERLRRDPPQTRLVFVLGDERRPNYGAYKDPEDALYMQRLQVPGEPQEPPSLLEPRVRHGRYVEYVAFLAGAEIGFARDDFRPLYEPAVLSASRARWLDGASPPECQDDVRLMAWLLSTMSGDSQEGGR